MLNVKFYSENDLSIFLQIDKIIEKIKSNDIELEWKISNLLSYYNVIKYINIEKFSGYIAEQTNIDMQKYKNQVNQKVGMFLGKNKFNYIDLYDEVEEIYVEDFFEVLVKYKIFENIDQSTFEKFLKDKDIYIPLILKFKKLISNFDEIIKKAILSDAKNAEIILLKYYDSNEHIQLPLSLNQKDILELINEYIDSPLSSINVLKKIIDFPANDKFNITDKIKLRAKRKYKLEEERFFENSTATRFKTGIMISYPENQEEVLMITNNEDNTLNIKISRKWISDNPDYPTLWNNFIYLFDFFDNQIRLNLFSKKSEERPLEILYISKAQHLYHQSSTFRYKEMIADLQILSYVDLLELLNIKIEEMIYWFFNVYLKQEFRIDNYLIKMPSSEASYFEKCRTILPEIDRIFKQYNSLVEDGVIDQELIQMSSSGFKIKDIKSFNCNKYVYSSSEWYQKAVFLLFSNQSGIFYLPEKKDKYDNFFSLMLNENLKEDDFEEYQLLKLKWLIDNDVIFIDDDGYLVFLNTNIISVLKELYFNEVISYWHCSLEIQKTIEKLYTLNLVEFEDSLFSRGEQDYFDYYLNKSKFTNGYDIRNKYLHGTNANDEKQYEIDYNYILKLFVIIIVKINDDLCIRDIK